MTAGPATCPRCGSTSIQAVPVEKKKLGEAALAEYFFGTAAGVAASSSTVIQAVCLSCGAQWFPGTESEKRMRALAGQLGEPAKQAEQQRVVEAQRQGNTTARIVVWGILLIAMAITAYAVFWYKPK